MSTLGDIMKIQFEGTLPTDDTMMITRALLHQDGPTVDDQLVAEALATRFESAWDNINTNVSANVVFDLVRLFAIDAVTAELNEVANEPITGCVGTGVGDALPNQTSLVIRVTASPLRRSGRFYLPGYVEGSQTDDLFGVPVVSAAISFALELLAPLTVASTRTFHFGTWSRSLNEFFPVAGTFGLLNVKSQRRRQGGIGE